jgi:hypothetical protein
MINAYGALEVSKAILRQSQGPKGPNKTRARVISRRVPAAPFCFVLFCFLGEAKDHAGPFWFFTA